ncbi:MAG: hypothetical protein HY905_17200 [Deltaproteobacteria bacterium]|nr:hypothetical protein [Deltaproteobacteria bacterium]
MSRIVGVGLWLVVGMLAGACGSNGGNSDAGDGGADAEPDGGDVVPDVDDAEEAADEAAEEDSGPLPLDLALGEVVELTAGEGGEFAADLATPGDDRQFGLVFYSAAWVTGTLSYELSATGAAASRAGDGAAKAGGPPWDRPGRDFSALEPELARALRGGGARIARDPLPTPVVGDHRDFQIDDPSAGVVTVDGECIAVGDDIAAWVDRTTTTPSWSDPDAATLAEVMAGFDGTVLPREREYFGDEPDIDTDGVVNVLWSPIVYELGAMAYFYPCDLFDSGALPLGCPYSNEQEILYATPPSMLDPRMARPSSILDTISHELQHLIYFHHKVSLGGGRGDDNAYILEGWAEVGEDVSGYGRGIFFIQQAGLQDSDQYGAIEILRNGGGYDTARDGMLRGASYLFLRYLWDRAGGERVETDGSITDLGSVAWAHETIDSALEGRANFADTVGAPIDDIVFDWYTALLLTGRTDGAGEPLPVEARFTYLPRVVDAVTGNNRGLDPYGDFMGMFNLEGAHTVTLATADGEIPPTGNELVLLEADGTSPTLSVRVTGSETAALRVRVARVR